MLTALLFIQEKLIQSRCDSEHHFLWTSQLRLELREDISEAERSKSLTKQAQILSFLMGLIWPWLCLFDQ